MRATKWPSNLPPSAGRLLTLWPGNVPVFLLAFMVGNGENCNVGKVGNHVIFFSQPCKLGAFVYTAFVS